MTRTTTISRRGGFTLIELLVVIGILVLLASILTPMVMSARRQADKTRTKMDLNTVALALEAYKKDFNDYPRPTPNAATERQRTLAWALIGPFQADLNSSADPTYTPDPGDNAIYDGADGPGFRTVWDKTTKTGGKVWGPYLPPEKFKVSANKRDLLDRYNRPIEYFPRWRNAGAPSLFGFTPTSANPANGTGLGIYDCRQTKNAGAVFYFERALGDDNVDDKISGTETLKLTPPPEFLLISRGYREQYTFQTQADTQDPAKKDLSKLDEVTNLE
ncbi:MAG TPA: prepilin-type N-terminal cleavage/methylation domain-containing protein [Tepidisphaeraceae bacterium]|jgi:prepilin-type N-terminal cleavage/methylation domain-containing protein